MDSMHVRGTLCTDTIACLTLKQFKRFNYRVLPIDPHQQVRLYFMSPPTFSSFPTTILDPPSRDSHRAQSDSKTEASATSRRSDKRESSTAHRHRDSAKRRRKEDHGSRQLSRDTEDVDLDLALRLVKHDHRHESPGQSGSKARDGLSRWSTEQPLSGEPMGDDYAGVTRSHYLDAIGDKEAHRYGVASSLDCPRYRRDQSTCPCCPRR